MNRRKFIRNTSALTVPIVLNGMNVFAGKKLSNVHLQQLANAAQMCGKILVIVQMHGGNDGLNTVIPLDQYSNLANARSRVIIPSSQILPLNGNPTTGFHPSLAGMRNMYNDGLLNIVQGVSYPNPDFSHFFSHDIWQTGSSGVPTLTTGWLGRVLDQAHPGFPTGYPNANNPDPLAVQIGGSSPLCLQGPKIGMSYNVSNPENLYNIASGTTGAVPANDYGTELAFLRIMVDQSNAYTARVSAAYNAQNTLSSLYPASNNELAAQLKIVARLIGGGLKSSVYVVNQEFSYDTHTAQVVQGNTATGEHATYLKKLSDAIVAFQNDITLMGKQDLVTGMTFTEFGRRVIDNDGIGTDHGVGVPVFFFGSKIKSGMIGSSPVIPSTTDWNTQVPLQYDYRQLYSTILQDWFCHNTTEASNILGGNFNKLPIFHNPPLSREDFNLVGQHINHESVLSLNVLTNTKFDEYIVEFSTDKLYFKEINRIKNNSLSENVNYSIKHQVDYRNMYYRVKGILKNGGIKYSNLLHLRSSMKKQMVSVYPNPITNRTVYLKLFEKPNTAIDVNIYDITGAKLYINKFNTVNSIFYFRLPEHIVAKSHYIIEVSYNNEVARQEILVL